MVQEEFPFIRQELPDCFQYTSMLDVIYYLKGWGMEEYTNYRSYHQISRLCVCSSHNDVLLNMSTHILKRINSKEIIRVVKNPIPKIFAWNNDIILFANTFNIDKKLRGCSYDLIMSIPLFQEEIIMPCLSHPRENNA